MTISTSLALPPQLPGLPVLGNVLDFHRDPVALCRRGHAELGPLFALRLGPQRAAVMIGPAYHKLLLTETDNLFSVQEVYKILRPITGPETGYEIGARSYKTLRKQVTSISFQVKRFADYLQIIMPIVQSWLTSLGPSGVFDAEETIGRLVLELSAATLIGADFREVVGGRFWALFRDLFGGIDFLLPANLPLPRFIRRRRARAQLVSLIQRYVRELKTRNYQSSEFLRSLAQFAQENCPEQAEDMVASTILSTVWGAHGTTTAHICWTLIQLLQHPEYLEGVLAESQLELRGETTSMDGVHRMQRLEWALKETERMHPTMPLLPRYVTRAVQLDRFVIPRGWLAFLCPAVAHRLPQVFNDPDRYDPERFGPGRDEEHATPYGLIGFGGGGHRCTGENFAYLLMKVVIASLLQRYELRCAPSAPVPQRGFVVTAPERPCRLHYTRRAAAS